MDAPPIPEHDAAGHGGKIMDAFTHKYHGVPGYAIAGVAVVGVVVIVKLKGGSSSAAGTGNPGGSTLVPNASGLDGGGGSGGGASGDPTADTTIPFVDGTLPSTFVPDSVFDTTPSTPQSGALAVPSLDTVPPPSAMAAPVPTQVTQTLDVTQAGNPYQQVQAPIFPIGTPASTLYEAVGLHASDPYTLLPANVAPESPAQHAEVVQAQAERQAQVTASKTHTAVAI